MAALRALPRLRLFVSSANRYSAGYMQRGLRSGAEASHLERVRSALPGCTVTNRPELLWQRGVGGPLQALFDVSARQQLAAHGGG